MFKPFNFKENSNHMMIAKLKNLTFIKQKLKSKKDSEFKYQKLMKDTIG